MSQIRYIGKLRNSESQEERYSLIERQIRDIVSPLLKLATDYNWN